MTPRKRVEIEWRDSTAAHGWQTASEGIVSWDDLVTTSVGYLIHEDEQTVTITSSVGVGDPNGAMCPLTIPRFAITSIHTLRR